MKDYKQLLKELPSNTVVCALGDFDPPTVAHELLVKTVTRLAESKGSAHVIFTSPSKTLQEDKKSQYLKLMFPKTNFTSIEESFASSIEQLKQKYKNVIVVVGSEQSTGLRKAIKESVEFIAITEKNPDADTSKMKTFATKALFEEFKKKLPSTLRELDSRRLMNDVRVGMGLDPIKEQINLVKDTLREKYFRGEIFNVGDIVESNGVQYTIAKRGSNHLLLKEESGELVSKWIHDVKSINEGVVQPSGTDQVIPSGPNKVDSKDQNGNPVPKDKGVTKGYLTFYNYTKDQNDFKVAKMEQFDYRSVSDDDKDGQSDLDADLQHLQIYDPKEVGNSMTHPIPHKGSHHLRRMKIRYAFKEQIEEAKKKKELPNTDVSRSGNLNAVGSENMHSFGEDSEIEIPKDAPSIQSIADKHGVSVAQIQAQLVIGMKVEAEHGKNPGSEKEIALDHLNERPDYYTRLKKFVEGLEDACWKGYTAIGMKKKNGKKVPNCVKEDTLDESHVEFRVDHRDNNATGDAKKTMADHEAKVSDITDKATYIKVPSHKADSFKSAMKGHGVKVELAEAHKIGDKVVITKGSEAGKTGTIGEIRTGLYQGAPKTYTVDHEGGSIQLKKTHLKSFKESALSDFRKAAAEREKKHDEIEAKRKEAAAQGKENMSGAIDRLEKTLNKESIEEAKKKPVCPTCGKHECECGEQRPGIGTETSMSKDPFFKEDADEDFDLSEAEIDQLIADISDEEVADLYEESELAIIDEETGEELPAVDGEEKIDLMEVLSRQERMRAKMRLRRTQAKRERSTKIALKRYSNTETINKRARRLAIKLMKKRMLRGRDLSKISVGEKERLERMIEKRKALIGRIATKLVSRVRKVEKARMSHSKFTQGSAPSVF